MKLKINKNFKKPKWFPGESYMQYEERIKAKIIYVTGGVGYSGQKIHRLRLAYLEIDNGIGIINVDSFCGVAKFNSKNIPYFDTDLSKVNCKRCLPK